LKGLSIETVELIVEQEKSREEPQELIVRFLSALSEAEKDCEVYPEGLPDVYDAKVYGGYRKTFYLTAKELLTVRPEGYVHILDYREVNREFFAMWKYPDPGPLWELLDTLRRRMARGVKFTGPPHLRPYIKNLADSARKAFCLEKRPLVWQAAVSCECGDELFAVRYFGKLLSSGSLSNLPDVAQRSELVCKGCGRVILLFDPTLHGYDAAICGWAPGATGPREANHDLACRCRGKRFRIAVEAVYSAVVDDVPARQRNESYEWFTAFVKCERCRRVARFVDYECA
jgi:hypothetical protein